MLSDDSDDDDGNSSDLSPRWRLQRRSALWDAAAVVSLQHPIKFEDVEERRLESHVGELASDICVAAFYVGATMDPERRWVGGPTPRGHMVGHKKRWDEMHVIHLQMDGARAAVLEKRLIIWSRDTHARKCKNVAPDARGLVRNRPNFLYVCLKTIISIHWDGFIRAENNNKQQGLWLGSVDVVQGIRWRRQRRRRRRRGR